MNIAIVGSRTFADHAVIGKSIRRWMERVPLDGPLVIVSGGAKGADSIGEAYAIEYGLDVVVHYPDWNAHGRSAGFVRNRDIVADADVVLAFFADGARSAGTQNTVTLAAAQGKPVYIYHEGGWTHQEGAFA